VDAPAHFGAENVIHEAMLSNATEPAESGGRDDRVEVMAVAGHLGARAGNSRLDPLLELLRRRLCRHTRHSPKRSEPPRAAILREA
jgi:hypothetical protein